MKNHKCWLHGMERVILSFPTLLTQLLFFSCVFILLSVFRLQMDVFDAAERYRQEGRQLIILAGKDYGSGSSRDWAAKGPWMQVCERIDEGNKGLESTYKGCCSTAYSKVTRCSSMFFL